MGRKRSLYILLGASALMAAMSTGTVTTQTAAAKEPWKTTTFRTATGIPATTVSNGHTAVTTYGDAVVAEINEGANSVEVVVDPGVTTVQQAKQARSGDAVPPTVYEMTLASGMSEADACEFAKDMDGYGCRTSAQVMAARKSSRATGTSSLTTGNIYDSDCYDHVTYEGDGSKHAHACVVRRFDFQNSTTLWLSNSMKTSGWVKDPGTMYDRLTSVGVQAQYKASNSFAVDWDPYTSQTVGSCREESTTVQGRSGTSFSTSSTVCPDTLSPWHSPEFQYFGAKWKGGPVGEGATRGAVATSIQKIPESQGAAYVIGSYLAWN